MYCSRICLMPVSKNKRIAYRSGTDLPVEQWGKRNTFGVSMASDIVIDDVSMRFGETQVLNKIDLNIVRGEVLSLLGPSGSGKTTLLRIIAGLEEPCGGSVVIDGKVMSDELTFVAPEKRGIGLVFQDYALFPHLTILGNVKFGLQAMAAKEANEQARRVLSHVGLSRYEKSYPHQLSGGEQQRVALARALAPRPGILLMDEPFSGLDARMREEIREQTIGLLRDTRSTVVIVTHDPEEALRVSDHIALMQQGALIQSGTCHDLYYKPQSKFAAKFFTDLNTFHGVVKNGSIETPFGAIKTDRLAEGKSGVVCVRLADVNVNIKPKKKVTKKPGNEVSRSVLAQIKKRQFMGVVEQFELFVPGIEEPIRARMKAGHLPQDLKMVSVSTKLDAIMVFEDK